MRGWKPTITDGGASGDDEAPTPPRRRRRAPVTEASETPRLDAAAKKSPRVSTSTRPRAGKHSVRSQEDDDRTGRSIRLGKRWSEVVTAIKTGEYTWRQFVEGLDEDEILRCQLRADNGTFMGRPPSFVPREFLLACQREQKRRFEEIFGSEVLGIARQYVELCKDQGIPGKDRAKMMQYAMERIFGGIPKDIRIAQEQPWETVFVNVTNDGSEDMPDHLRERYERYKERDADPEG